MLMPKRVKFRRVQRGRLKGKALRGNTLSNGTYGRIGIKVWIYGGEVLVSSAKAPRRREGGRK